MSPILLPYGDGYGPAKSWLRDTLGPEYNPEYRTSPLYHDRYRNVLLSRFKRSKTLWYSFEVPLDGGWHVWIKDVVDDVVVVEFALRWS